MAETTEAVVRILIKVRTCKHLPEVALRALARGAKLERYAVGGVIIQQGQMLEAIVVMQMGHVSVLRAVGGARGGHTVLRIGRATPTQVFGARAVTQSGVASTSLVCETPCVVARIQRRAFLELADAEVGRALVDAEPWLPSDDRLMRICREDLAWEQYVRKHGDVIAAEQRHELGRRVATASGRPRSDPVVPTHALVPTVGGPRQQRTWDVSRAERLIERSHVLLLDRVATLCDEDDESRMSPHGISPVSLKTAAMVAAELSAAAHAPSDGVLPSRQKPRSLRSNDGSHASTASRGARLRGSGLKALGVGAHGAGNP